MQVRALAGWPGTGHEFILLKRDGTTQPLLLKILVAAVAGQLPPSDERLPPQSVQVHGSRIFIECGDGGALELLKVQPAGKAAMSAQAFANGLSGSTLKWQ